MRIEQILQGKADATVGTVPPDATMGQVVAELNRRNVGALVVSPDGRRVAGIVSERDVVRRLTDPGLLGRPVVDVMTADVRTCTADQDVETLMGLMTEHRIRHLPVVADSALVGIISIGDLVKSRIGELEFERDQLDQYLHQT